MNLASAPLTHLKLYWDSPYDSIQVEIEEGVFNPLRHVLHLWTIYDLFNEIPISLNSELEMLQIFLDTSNRDVNDTTLEAYAKWNATLRHLDISLSQINSISDKAFAWFPELRILDISGSIFPLFHIADQAFYGLYKLEELYLARNYLNMLPVSAFNAFADTMSLRVLDLSYNCLNGAFNPDDFSAVSSLKVLNVSHNPMYIVDEWMNVFTNLTEFRIDSINSEGDLFVPDAWTATLHFLTTISFQTPNNKDILKIAPFDLSKRAPNLRTLFFDGTQLFTISTIANLTELQHLDVSGSFVKEKRETVDEWSSEIYYPNLNTLNMALNELTSKHVSQLKLNVTVPMIKHLDLSNNLIEYIDSATIGVLRYLEYVDLGNNRLLYIDKWHPQYSITHLYLSHNSISHVPDDFVTFLQSSEIAQLDLSGNPFTCTCIAIESFRKWILHDSRVYLIPNLMYQCNEPKTLSGRSVTEISLNCASYFYMYLGIGISGGVVLFLSVILAIRYRYHIRYGLFLLCHQRRKYRAIDNNENELLVNEIRYDAFVSYAHDNEHDLDWVLNDLTKNLEEGQEPFRLCVGHARDFIPGTPLLEAITESIHKSRKTILVLSPSYLDSEWCYFETQHAWLRLLNEGQDVLILILLEQIPDDKMTMWLRQFLCKKECLTWPRDRGAQNLFFQCLREIIKKPTAVDRRYDV